MAKTYVVTGVASGIGAEISKLLRDKGHHVIGLDVHDASATVDRFVPLDLNDPGSVTAAANTIDGPLDGLCNNAGLPPRDGLEEAILQVNFLGQRQLTQALLPKIKRGGSIVNMASRAGAKWRDNLDQVKRFAALRGPDELTAFVQSEALEATRCYDLSKEAMILWTLALTEDLFAHDLRANAISPGAIATGILDDFRRAFGDRMTRNVTRAGRPGTAREVAQIAAFLLSDQSAWMKGVDIPVDGGMGAFNISDALGLDVMKLGDADVTGNTPKHN